MILVILMDILLNEVFAGLQEAYSRDGLYRLGRYECEVIKRFGESQREDVEAIFTVINEQIIGMRRRYGAEFMRFFSSSKDLRNLEIRVRAVFSTSVQQAA